MIIFIVLCQRGAGRNIGHLPLVIRLNLQQGHDTVPKAVILFMAGAVLFGLGMEELATERFGCHFAYHELRTTLGPILYGRAHSQFIGKLIELKFAVRQLHLHQFAVTLLQYARNKFLFCFGEIGNVYVSGHVCAQGSPSNRQPLWEFR